MIGHRLRQSLGQIGMRRVEGQECHDCPVEVLDVYRLGFLSSARAGFLLLSKTLRRSLDFEFSANPVDGCRPCPHAVREDLSAPLFLHDPMLARTLYPPCQGGVTGRQENPATRDGQGTAIGSSDRPWSRAGREGTVHPRFVSCRFTFGSKV